jgi:hypothetical protein
MPEEKDLVSLGDFLAAQRKECGELFHALGGIFLGI